MTNNWEKEKRTMRNHRNMTDMTCQQTIKHPSLIHWFNHDPFLIHLKKNIYIYIYIEKHRKTFIFDPSIFNQNNVSKQPRAKKPTTASATRNPSLPPGATEFVKILNTKHQNMVTLYHFHTIIYYITLFLLFLLYPICLYTYTHTYIYIWYIYIYTVCDIYRWYITYFIFPSNGISHRHPPILKPLTPRLDLGTLLLDGLANVRCFVSPRCRTSPSATRK